MWSGDSGATWAGHSSSQSKHRETGSQTQNYFITASPKTTFSGFTHKENPNHLDMCSNCTRFTRRSLWLPIQIEGKLVFHDLLLLWFTFPLWFQCITRNRLWEQGVCISNTHTHHGRNMQNKILPATLWMKATATTNEYIEEEKQTMYNQWCNEASSLTKALVYKLWKAF